jgi:hypothetical protein
MVLQDFLVSAIYRLYILKSIIYLCGENFLFITVLLQVVGQDESKFSCRNALFANIPN